MSPGGAAVSLSLLPVMCYDVYVSVRKSPGEAAIDLYLPGHGALCVFVTGVRATGLTPVLNRLQLLCAPGLQ